MASGKQAYYILAAISVIVIIWVIADNIKKSTKIKELQEDLDNNKLLDKSLREKLEVLIRQHPNLDIKIQQELNDISILLQAKQEIKATFTLAKIIERLLKEKYGASDKALEVAKKKGRRKPSYIDFLELAKNEGLVSNEEYHFLSILKLYRNEEAHELAVKKEKSKIESLFLVGITFISNLSKKAAKLAKT